MSAVPRSFAPQARFVPMTVDWLDRVLPIEQAVYSHPWSRNNFADSLHSGYQAQLLLGGQEILGYFIAMKGVDEVHLLNLTVAPAWQRQGWARMQLDALAIWARGQGAQWLWLEVRASNERALQIYREHGYRRVGERKNYYPATSEGREDAVIMSLRLET